MDKERKRLTEWKTPPVQKKKDVVKRGLPLRFTGLDAFNQFGNDIKKPNSIPSPRVKSKKASKD
jgi:hypothetical protein